MHHAKRTVPVAGLAHCAVHYTIRRIDRPDPGADVGRIADVRPQRAPIPVGRVSARAHPPGGVTQVRAEYAHHVVERRFIRLDPIGAVDVLPTENADHMGRPEWRTRVVLHRSEGEPVRSATRQPRDHMTRGHHMAASDHDSGAPAAGYRDAATGAPGKRRVDNDVSGIRRKHGSRLAHVVPLAWTAPPKRPSLLLRPEQLRGLSQWRIAGTVSVVLHLIDGLPDKIRLIYLDDFGPRRKAMTGSCRLRLYA